MELIMNVLPIIVLGGIFSALFFVGGLLCDHLLPHVNPVARWFDARPQSWAENQTDEAEYYAAQAQEEGARCESGRELIA